MYIMYTNWVKRSGTQERSYLIHTLAICGIIIVVAVFIILQFVILNDASKPTPVLFYVADPFDLAETLFTLHGYTDTAASRQNSNSTSYPWCPAIPSNLRGVIPVNFTALTDDEVHSAVKNSEGVTVLSLGEGHFVPLHCQARSKVAIVIPYRNRSSQLKTFLAHMHPILQRQELDYSIIVVEQGTNDSFNRALLMNIGFAESSKHYPWDCYIFHDVDILAENDHNMYRCPFRPRHMSGYINKFNYTLSYPEIFGGVSAIPAHIFRQVNGYSNLFFGWGGEDDDMFYRLRYHHRPVTRYGPHVSRMKMWIHEQEANNSPNLRRRAMYKYVGGF